MFPVQTTHTPIYMRRRSSQPRNTQNAIHHKLRHLKLYLLGNTRSELNWASHHTHALYNAAVSQTYSHTLPPSHILKTTGRRDARRHKVVRRAAIYQSDATSTTQPDLQLYQLVRRTPPKGGGRWRRQWRRVIRRASGRLRTHCPGAFPYSGTGKPSNWFARPPPPAPGVAGAPR